jgi:hypothetical protein
MTQEDYGRLIGILFTDGCVSPKGSSWRIIVSNNSSSIVDAFENTIHSCFGKSVRRFMRGKLSVAVLDSKEVGQILIERVGTFRTEACQSGQGCPFLRGGRKPCRVCDPICFDGIQYPPATLPNLDSNVEISAFLQAAFSCDGGINLYVAHRGSTKWLIRNVYLACKHPTLIQQYAGYLGRLGIKSRIMPKDWRILVQGRMPITLFASFVGFLPGSVIGANSPFWCGRTKSAILELLLESYGNPRMIYDLPVFSSENIG